jgi:hypothetical protein
MRHVTSNHCIYGVVIEEVFKEFFLKSSKKEFVTRVGDLFEATDDGQEEEKCGR